MEFNYIVNPKSGKRVSIYSATVKKILHNYIKYLTLGGNIKKRKSKNKQQIKKKFLQIIER